MSAAAAAAAVLIAFQEIAQIGRMIIAIYSEKHLIIIEDQSTVKMRHNWAKFIEDLFFVLSCFFSILNQHIFR